MANIAQWNGESWDPVGTGTERPVLALATSGANVYAGGAFDSAGQVPGTAHVARWDGSAWQPLGGGTPGFADEVHSIVVSGTSVYIAGDFTEAGGVAGARNVARWDGAQWRALATGVDGHVSALAIAGGDLYAAGEFTSVGGTAVSRLAFWDGVGWHAVGEGANGHIETLVPAPDRATLFAGGSFTKFNGATRLGLTAFGAPHTGAPVVTLTIRAQHLSLRPRRRSAGALLLRRALHGHADGRSPGRSRRGAPPRSWPPPGPGTCGSRSTTRPVTR